ncbi:MAG: hypothetical protein OS130_07355 [Thermodesulfobacteriota bacterium]|jgi:hypothetical protein|nr:MAG: hypothetical protein OS130_07355 [Thermodesulfobacteriota bacterium]
MKKIIFVAIIFGAFLLSKPLAILAQESTNSGGEAISVSEKCLKEGPCCYLGKYIVTEGVYLDTSTAILDDWYHGCDTRFSSRDFLNFRTNEIFQYFMEQCKAELICPLKAGDKITISGWVESCEDKRPWILVNSVVKAPSE